MRRSRREFLEGAAAAAVLTQLGLISRRAGASIPAVDGTMAELYSLAPDVTYLNHASIGTVPIAVQRAHQGYLDLCETNPWLYMWSEPWAEPREAVRARAANLLGCASEELAITHNTTEFFNVLAQGLPLGPGDEVLFSSLNHAGASVCWLHQAPVRGFAARRFDFPLDDIATIDEETVVSRYVDAIGPRTRLLVMPHVDNQVGLRHPVARIAAAARERGVRWIAVDGAQTASMLPLDVREMGVDVFATSAHKWIQSPKGLGLTYVRRAMLSELRPMWVTWGQERWRGDARIFEDYGTRAMPAVLALGDALAFQEGIRADRREAHYRALRDALLEWVDRREDLAWRSPRDWSVGASLVAVEVRGRNSVDVAAELFRQHGIVVRPFSLPGLNALRVSPNLANEITDLERLVELI